MMYNVYHRWNRLQQEEGIKESKSEILRNKLCSWMKLLKHALTCPGKSFLTFHGTKVYVINSSQLEIIIAGTLDVFKCIHYSSGIALSKVE